MEDPYNTLGVGRAASPEQIKKAYRKRAKDTHPDREGDANEFRKVHEAYLLLRDPERRERYDRTGHTDPPPVTNPDKWFVEIVYEPLIKVIVGLTDTEDAVETNDVLELLVESLEGQEAALHEEDQTYLKAVKALKKAMKRFKTKEENNILASILGSNLKDCQGKLEQIAERRKLLKKAIKRLDKYSYEYKEVEASGGVATITVPHFGFGFTDMNEFIGGFFGPKKPRKPS